MYESNKVLALIPARGGSRRLPGKNLRLMRGVPLIVHTIRAALRSSFVDRVVVSTDDPEICAVALEHGAEVPFMRPAELAKDTSSSEDVIRHAIRELGHFDYLALLQPTSPLRTANIIDECIRKCTERAAPSCITVFRVKHGGRHFFDMNLENGALTRLLPPQTHGDAASNTEVTQVNGAVYVVNVDEFLVTNRIISSDTAALVMPEWMSIDIDVEEEFRAAEVLLILTE